MGDLNEVPHSGLVQFPHVFLLCKDVEAINRKISGFVQHQLGFLINIYSNSLSKLIQAPCLSLQDCLNKHIKQLRQAMTGSLADPATGLLCMPCLIVRNLALPRPAPAILLLWSAQGRICFFPSITTVVGSPGHTL